MDKKQVLIRVSHETHARIQLLSEKYGMSASALLVSLVNERWLKENSTVNSADEAYLQNLPDETEKQQIPSLATSRKRHKSKRH